MMSWSTVAPPWRRATAPHLSQDECHFLSKTGPYSIARDLSLHLARQEHIFAAYNKEIGTSPPIESLGRTTYHFSPLAIYTGSLSDRASAEDTHISEALIRKEGRVASISHAKTPPPYRYIHRSFSDRPQQQPRSRGSHT